MSWLGEHNSVAIDIQSTHKRDNYLVIYQDGHAVLQLIVQLKLQAEWQ